MIARRWWLDEEESFPTVGKPTALVVDDPPASLNATARVLERFGFLVFTAGSAEEAERVVDQLSGPLDVLITEAVLPDARGDILVRLLRLKGQRPSVLYITGESRIQLHGRGFGGLDAPVVRKPLDADELARQVRALLEL